MRCPSFEIDRNLVHSLIAAAPGGRPESMFRTFNESAADLPLPPLPEGLPFAEMTALSHLLRVVYPDGGPDYIGNWQIDTAYRRWTPDLRLTPVTVSPRPGQQPRRQHLQLVSVLDPLDPAVGDR